MSRQLSLLCSLAIAAPALGACASSFSPRDARFAADTPPLVVEVQNLNWWDMEVELDAEGGQFRLGVAPSYGRVRFLVSSRRLGGASCFRLIGNPMDTGRTPFAMSTGQGVITTRVVELLDGRHAYWTVGSSETTPNLVVRGG